MLGIIFPFLFLQLICTGTFYEEWFDEAKKFNLPNVISGICVVLGLYFTARVVYSNHKAKKSGIIAPKPENVEETNFGAIPRTWMVTAMIWIAVFSLGKFNR